MRNIPFKLLHLVLIMLIVLVSGCGLFKKVSKIKESSLIETTSKVKKDSTGITIDKTLITTIEKIDTTVMVPGKKVIQASPLNMDSLVNGMTAIKSDLVDVKLMLDQKTGVLTASAFIKPQAIPVKFDKKTTQQNNITKSEHKSESQDSRFEKKATKSDIQKEPTKMWVWLISGVAMLIAISLIIRVSKTKLY